MDTFKELKEEIIKRAKEKNACVNAFKKACESETIEQLMEVVKNNFNWCCCNILDANFINKYKSEFNKNNIFCNESVNSGYLLVTDTCTIYGNDNCTINGYDKCTIEGNSNCTINGYDKCTIEGNGNCTIYGNDNCYIYSYSIKECKLNNNAIYRVIETNTIYYANDSIKFEKLNN